VQGNRDRKKKKRGKGGKGESMDEREGEKKGTETERLFKAMQGPRLERGKGQLTTGIQMLKTWEDEANHVVSGSSGVVEWGGGSGGGGEPVIKNEVQASSKKGRKGKIETD